MQTTTKTETPKQDTNPFASAMPFASFDPMAYWTTSQQTFHKLVQDTCSRAQAFAEQYATLEAQLLTRANGAVASWSQMTQDALNYGAQLSADARKLGFDAIRKASAGS